MHDSELQKIKAQCLTLYANGKSDEEKPYLVWDEVCRDGLIILWCVCECVCMCIQSIPKRR